MSLVGRPEVGGRCACRERGMVALHDSFCIRTASLVILGTKKDPKPYDPVGTPLFYGWICMVCILDKGDFITECILYGVGNLSVNMGGFSPVSPITGYDYVGGKRKTRQGYYQGR